MAHTTHSLPRGFWKKEADTLRRIAPTMTMAQLMAHYGVSRTRMLQELRVVKVDFIGKQKDALNREQIKQLPELAKTLTPGQIANHFGIPTKFIYAYLSRRKIKAQATTGNGLWESRRAELEQITQHMTLRQLQAHYQAQGYTHTLGALRQALYLMKLDWVHSKAQSPLLARKPELQEMAKHLTCRQMAESLGITRNHMWKMLHKMGITPLHGKDGPAAKPKAATKPKPSKTPKLTKPAAHMVAAMPARTSIASKTPAQIIWPEHVQIQRIPLATPPAHAPICASTARGTYTPSRDWYRSPRAM